MSAASAAPSVPLGQVVRRFALILFLVALVGCFALMSPYFLSVYNITNILLAMSVIGMIAAVNTLVLVGRALDLSTGSVIGLSAVVVAACLSVGVPWWASCLAGIGVGAVCGLVNGLIVTWIRIDPIIATIGTLSVFRGLAFVSTGGQTIYVDDPVVIEIGSGRLFGIPYSVAALLAMFLLCHFVAVYTRIGRTIFAIGANPRASMLTGLNLTRYRLGLFIVSGIASAIAGILLIGQSGTATPSAGLGAELLMVTAILLGGASLHGGEGRVSGTLIGVLIIGVLANGMTLLGINSYYQTVANGLLLLISVSIDQLRSGPRQETA